MRVKLVRRVGTARASRAPGPDCASSALAAALVATTLPAVADCPDLQRRFDSALRGRQLTEVRRLEQKLVLDVCADEKDVVLPRSEVEVAFAEAWWGRPGAEREREALLVAAHTSGAVLLAGYVSDPAAATTSAAAALPTQQAGQP